MVWCIWSHVSKWKWAYNYKPTISYLYHFITVFDASKNSVYVMYSIHWVCYLMVGVCLITNSMAQWHWKERMCTVQCIVEILTTNYCVCKHLCMCVYICMFRIVHWRKLMLRRPVHVRLYRRLLNSKKCIVYCTYLYIYVLTTWELFTCMTCTSVFTSLFLILCYVFIYMYVLFRVLYI